MFYQMQVVNKVVNREFIRSLFQPYFPLGIPRQVLCDSVFWMVPFSSSKLFPLNVAHIESRILLTAVLRSVGTSETRVIVKTPSPFPLNDRLTIDFSSSSFVILIFVRLMSMFPTISSLGNISCKTGLFQCLKEYLLQIDSLS